MSINIKATNTTLTPSTKDFLQRKLDTLKKFLKPEHKLYVEFEVDKKHRSGLIYRVEITIYPHNFFAESRGNDFYEATDLAIPKIKEQLVKAKDKHLKTKRQKARKTARALKRAGF